MEELFNRFNDIRSFVEARVCQTWLLDPRRGPGALRGEGREGLLIGPGCSGKTQGPEARRREDARLHCARQRSPVDPNARMSSLLRALVAF